MGKKRRRSVARAGDAEEEDLELTGFVCEGELYLRDASGSVYSSERDCSGQLVRLGTWDGSTSSPVWTPADAEAQQAAPASSSPLPSLPPPPPQPLCFEADEIDHCETAPEAYAHVVPVLRRLSQSRNIDTTELRIYDPYYCNGAVERHLLVLGFPCVHNVNEDFYATQRTHSLPQFDLLLTNPPYSGSHPERLLEFCSASSKPWLLLMPNWVFARAYYSESLPALKPAFYIVPRKRYHYWTPRGRRSDIVGSGPKARTHGHTNAALGARTSPFISFWVGGGFPPSLVSKLFRRAPEGCMLFRRLEDLPAAVRANGAPQGGTHGNRKQSMVKKRN
uniref:Uncharacterized protein n=1 Tax=Calcidiscus leptoporus TaxID=127549 RepID=A0A6U5M4J8_9EUKA|mmetsp:Transcript_52576/g.120801  ORF Transcript_52576/g.120801 Transcript_52576/m.120801 type:complete len:335 (+) Transcript_52576:43-1047(+)|eukprot:CAMPEP_0119374112 /NCGR_PEP_ID=MMETSP1334-20130426/29134_1 /TAXON_ID=127549 /ORGANISM="Calcidiscus leptoporus, Strain RCC1130" /LENGTH=334 /DNA_ID=CAMNT_0007392089 /DNA_START=95 /DNA_END=1099 /DNA_ORIENTATION=+